MEISIKAMIIGTLLGFANVSCAASAADKGSSSQKSKQNILIVTQDDGTEIKVPLGYPYYTGTRTDLGQALYVPQSMYAIIGKGQLACVGPLSPCILVVASHPKKSQLLVMHYSHENKPEDVSARLQQFILEQDRPLAVVEMFSQKYDTQVQGKKKHLSDVDQAARIKEVKALLEAVGFIRDKQHMPAGLLGGGDMMGILGEAGGKFLCSQKCVMVQLQGDEGSFSHDMHSVCLFTESYLRNSQGEVQSMKRDDLIHHLQTYQDRIGACISFVGRLAMKHRDSQRSKSPETYDKDDQTFPLFDCSGNQFLTVSNVFFD